MTAPEEGWEREKKEGAEASHRGSVPDLKIYETAPSSAGWQEAVSRHGIDTQSRTADKDRQSQDKAFRDKLLFSYIILAISALWAIPVAAGYYWWEKLLGLLVK